MKPALVSLFSSPFWHSLPHSENRSKKYSEQQSPPHYTRQSNLS